MKKYKEADMMLEFLKTSPIAEDVKLGANVVLHRSSMSTDELLAIEEEGSITFYEGPVQDYELEVNGMSVARGSIIRKKGEYFFKIKEMNGEAES